MSKQIKILIRLLIVIIVIGGTYYAYTKLRPGIIKKQRLQSQEVWKNAQEVVAKDQSFAYKIKTDSKDDKKDKYNQVVTGNFVNNQKISGAYKATNGTLTIEKEFILIDSIVYSKEGEKQNKWYIWNKDAYMEAIYYPPAAIIKAVDQEKVDFVKKKGNDFVFRCVLVSQPTIYGPSAGEVQISINKKTNLITKIEYQRWQNDLNLETVINYNDYGKQLEINPPPEDQIAK